MCQKIIIKSFLIRMVMIICFNTANGIKPIKEFFKKIDWVLSWKSPAATMLIFLVCLLIKTSSHTINVSNRVISGWLLYVTFAWKNFGRLTSDNAWHILWGFITSSTYNHYFPNCCAKEFHMYVLCSSPSGLTFSGWLLASHTVCFWIFHYMKPELEIVF